MKKTKIRKGPVVGAGQSTGVFITKSDMDQLIEVIAKAKARDILAAQLGTKQFGASGGGLIESATMGTISIQTFVRALADTYRLPKDKFYGVNRYGEFIEWVSIGRPN